MGHHRADPSPAKAPKFPLPRTQADGPSRRTHRNILRAENLNPVGRPPARNGLRLRHELLALPSRLAESRGLAENPRGDARPVERRRQDRLETRGRGLVHGTRVNGGAKVGPNPTDRAKAGSKHHLITDGNGVPFACILTSANAHDITRLIPLLDAIPPIRGKRGRPRHKPRVLVADHAYDSEPHREKLREMGILTLIARRNRKHGSGLGIIRWVVERTFAWLHRFRRLRVRYERRDDIHEAFLSIGCFMICWNCLNFSGES